jgi:Copper binding proteins, plastocyanin/azurin family
MHRSTPISTRKARAHLSMALLSLVAAAALVLSAPATAAPKVLNGTVGPGFSISLSSGGKKVTSLKAGTYRLDVTDRSAIHDFHLSGPGVNKVITSVSFQGRKSVTLTLKPGTYRYICDPHASVMKGSFRVS